jgi:hypothetical protein
VSDPTSVSLLVALGAAIVAVGVLYINRRRPPPFSENDFVGESLEETMTLAEAKHLRDGRLQDDRFRSRGNL